MASTKPAPNVHTGTASPPLQCPFSEAHSLDTQLPSGPVSTGAAQQQQPTNLDQLLSALPTVFRAKSEGRKGRSEGKYLETSSDVLGFVTQDLDVSRLNDIHGHLWMAGRPLSARPLHRQKMMDRRILYTEQADMHLLTADDRLYLKPIPLYLLSHTFWTTYLCENKELHAKACGFLMSYVWLIVSELDFHLARDEHSDTEHLLPKSEKLTWAWWKAFVQDFTAHVDPNALEQVNKRYHFGELRLGRINTIYRTTPRFLFTHFVRGYLYGYNRYEVFFQRNFAWVLVVFVWFSLVLSAMQVGVAVPPLNEDSAFKAVSYGFVVFSIALVLFMLVFVGVIFMIIFFFNMVVAVRHVETEKRRRKKFLDEKKGVKMA
ncbi:hypothetical protein W97_02160 [Coniosporium apollinis CBS 100218]|uniref:Uncharacterized protein n=1 Tax=Coniosporium apollinis (strain CBS 100218) TaxID=1168221 RepID=R7YM89_CONA1|nr:uncharacterized protein W97_02160 [Coniosporium apollinis CBS 100218]EON62934.1 hypothetical protein W97_02160 [Coniosporium apollinis CBS 100218]